jgi:hypothetical protein
MTCNSYENPSEFVNHVHDLYKGAFKMQIKITFALVLTALSSTLMAQQPVISIADSTGRRDAVVAIVIPPPVDLSSLTQKAAEQAQPLPWTARFLGQRKDIGSGMALEIGNDGVVYRVAQGYAPVKLFDIPQYNETLVLTGSISRTCGWGGRNGPGRYQVTNSVRYEALPLGITISNRIPTGWQATYTVGPDSAYCSS